VDNEIGACVLRVACSEHATRAPLCITLHNKGKVPEVALQGTFLPYNHLDLHRACSNMPSPRVPLQITLHKKGKLPKKVQSLKSPLLENANEYVIHGFTVNVRPPGTDPQPT
jgi:hypothetical protein